MNIAIVRLSAMGDIIQSMVVTQFLKKYVPDIKIDWIVESRFADILSENADINQIIPIDIKGLNGQKRLKNIYNLYRHLKSIKEYDIVIDLQGLIKSALVSRFIRAGQHIGFDKKSIREPIASLFYSKKFNIPYSENVIIRYIKLINNVFDISISNEDILDKKPFFKLSKKNYQYRPKPLIMIVIGASFKSKIYPISGYSEIINKINATFLVLWKTKSEEKLALKLCNLNPKAKMSPELDLKELKNTISSADLLVGGDTGPSHLAWAMNIPSVLIFGSTPKDRNCFTTKQNLAVSSNSGVNPYKINKNDLSINSIEPKEVISLIIKILNNNT